MHGIVPASHHYRWLVQGSGKGTLNVKGTRTQELDFFPLINSVMVERSWLLALQTCIQIFKQALSRCLGGLISLSFSVLLQKIVEIMSVKYLKLFFRKMVFMILHKYYWNIKEEYNCVLASLWASLDSTYLDPS